MSMRIGFMGLGAMGIPVAMNLAKNGYDVLGYDIHPNALEKYRMAGGRVAAGPSEIVAHSEVVFIMLPAGKDVQACVESLVAHGLKDRLLIDLSTTGVEAAHALHAFGVAHGLRVLDAPVTGGVMGAAKATLTIMVGGAMTDFDQAEPLFNAIGGFIKYAGPAGCGQAVKVCNNMAAGIIKIAISESFALARRMGIDDKVFFDVASKGSANCFALTVTCPVPGLVENAPSSHGYQGGFAAKLMLKDLKLAQHAASQYGVPLSLASMAVSVYEHCVAEGLGDYDNSIVYKFITKDDINN